MLLKQSQADIFPLPRFLHTQGDGTTTDRSTPVAVKGNLVYEPYSVSTPTSNSPSSSVSREGVRSSCSKSAEEPPSAVERVLAANIVAGLQLLFGKNSKTLVPLLESNEAKNLTSFSDEDLVFYWVYTKLLAENCLEEDGTIDFQSSIPEERLSTSMILGLQGQSGTDYIDGNVTVAIDFKGDDIHVPQETEAQIYSKTWTSKLFQNPGIAEGLMMDVTSWIAQSTRRSRDQLRAAAASYLDYATIDAEAALQNLNATVSKNMQDITNVAGSFAGDNAELTLELSIPDRNEGSFVGSLTYSSEFFNSTQELQNPTEGEILMKLVELGVDLADFSISKLLDLSLKAEFQANNTDTSASSPDQEVEAYQPGWMSGAIAAISGSGAAVLESMTAKRLLQPSNLFEWQSALVAGGYNGTTISATVDKFNKAYTGATEILDRAYGGTPTVTLNIDSDTFESCLSSDDDAVDFANYINNATSSLDDQAVEIVFLISTIYATVENVMPSEGAQMLLWGKQRGILKRFPEVDLKELVDSYFSSYATLSAQAAASWCSINSSEQAGSSAAMRGLLDTGDVTYVRPRLISGNEPSVDFEFVEIGDTSIPGDAGDLEAGLEENAYLLPAIGVLGEGDDRQLVYDESAEKKVAVIDTGDNVFENIAKTLGDVGALENNIPMFTEPDMPLLPPSALQFALEFVGSGIAQSGVEILTAAAEKKLVATSVAKAMSVGAKTGLKLAVVFPKGVIIIPLVSMGIGYATAKWSAKKLDKGFEKGLIAFTRRLNMEDLKDDEDRCRETYQESLCKVFENLNGFDYCYAECKNHITDRRVRCISWARAVMNAKERCQESGRAVAGDIFDILGIPEKVTKMMNGMDSPDDFVAFADGAYKLLDMAYGDALDALMRVNSIEADLELGECLKGAPSIEFKGSFNPQIEPECQPGYEPDNEPKMSFLRAIPKVLFGYLGNVYDQLLKFGVPEGSLQDSVENKLLTENIDDSFLSDIKTRLGRSEQNSTICRQVIKQGGLPVYESQCTSSLQLGSLDECQQFEFKSKPVNQGGQGVSESSCNDGFCWIEIMYNGESAWTTAGVKRNNIDCIQNDGAPPEFADAHVALCGSPSCEEGRLVKEVQCGELLSVKEECPAGGCRYSYTIAVPANNDLIIRYDMYSNPDRLQVHETSIDSEPILVYDSGYQGLEFSCATDKTISTRSREGCRGMSGLGRGWNFSLSPICPLRDYPVVLEKRSDASSSYSLTVDAECPGTAFDLIVECSNESLEMPSASLPIVASPGFDDDDDDDDDQECANESNDFMHYDYSTTPEIIKACQLLWTEGSVPKRVDSGIGGEIRCRRTSYEVAAGAWESPRPPVCDLIETAAASVGLSGLTPGCELWFWCTSPEPIAGEIDIQWTMYIQQTYKLTTSYIFGK